jgi:lysophospholipase L1-like esterase
MNGKIMKGIVASFAGMLVMACSGGGGSGTLSATLAIDPPASAPIPPKSINIDAEGDSTIHGAQVINGVTSQTPNSAPAVLQTTLRSAGFNATVQNSGQNGATADSAVEGLSPWYSATLATRLSTNPAQIVIGNYAINDSTLRTTDQYMSDLTQWIQIVRASGKMAILEEPNPVCAPYVPNLDTYVAAMRTVAQQNNVTLIAQYDYLKSLPDWQSMLTDCIHPTDAMYAIKGQREAEVLKPLVTSM